MMFKSSEDITTLDEEEILDELLSLDNQILEEEKYLNFLKQKKQSMISHLNEIKFCKRIMKK